MVLVEMEVEVDESWTDLSLRTYVLDLPTFPLGILHRTSRTYLPCILQEVIIPWGKGR
jgi:hypothetical protein